MNGKTKEVQGLLLKVAELEILVITLLGLLKGKELITLEDEELLFNLAESPELLGARIKQMEMRGVGLVKARKKTLIKSLGLAPSEEEPITPDALDVLEEAYGVSKEKDKPSKKFH